RLRVKQWLLLVLRMLAIACLVLAFARPTVESGVAGRIVGIGRTSAAVVLDNSVSMLQRDQNGDFFSQAKDEVLSLADDLTPADELIVLPLIADPGTGSARPSSPTLARDWVTEVEVRSGRAGLAAAIQRGILALSESIHPNKEMFLVSDFQSTNFPDSLDVDIPPGIRAYLVPVGSLVQDNAAVTSVEVVSSIVDQDQPVTVRATVSNFGETDLQNWGVSVYLMDDRVAQATIDLDAGTSAGINLVMSPGQRGWLPAYVEIEDDNFEIDNRRYFTLHVPQVRRILVVRGDDTNSQYVELALSRELSRGGSVFEIHPAQESALASVTIADYDAVVLHGVHDYSSGQIASLANYVSGGGGLFIFTGDSGPASDQQALLSALGGGSYTAMTGSRGAEVAVATLDDIDREHPIFSGVFDQNERARIDIGHPAVYRMAGYRPGAGDEHTVITTTSSVPFLQEIRGGKGRVLMVPFLPEPEWTDLPLRGLFVPLLHRSMYYLTSSEGESGDGVIAGSSNQIRLGTGQDSQVKLVSADGEEWIPEKRGGLRGLLLTIPPSIREPGVYDITADGTTIQRIAINGAPAESDLRRLGAAEVATRIESPAGYPVVVLNSTAAERSSAGRDNQQAGNEIWNVFLGLALVFLVLEMLVAKR
ncbi:hypothetical protein ACFLRO_01465, partial [Bacteroidota bacterium]